MLFSRNKEIVCIVCIGVSFPCQSERLFRATREKTAYKFLGRGWMKFFYEEDNGRIARENGNGRIILARLSTFDLGLNIVRGVWV